MSAGAVFPDRDRHHGTSLVRGSWLAEVDGLRALAALSVVLAHFSRGTDASSSAPIQRFLGALDRMSFANLGVMFFFTLSAFLLTYLGVREHDRTGGISLRRFYARRCLRIWPLYFTVLAADLLLVSPRGPLSPTYVAAERQWEWIWSHLWMFAGFLSNWSLALNNIRGHVDQAPFPLAILWSIGVEEQFYLFFPLLLALAVSGKRRAGLLAAGLLLLGVVFRLAFLLAPVDRPTMGASGGMYYATLTYADGFVAGSAAGWLAARRQIPAWMRWPGVGVVILLLTLGLGLIWHDRLWHPYALSSVVLYTATGVAFAACLLWVTSNPQAIVARVLRSRPLKTLGVLSYGIYMWHPMAATLTRTNLDPLIVDSPPEADLRLIIHLTSYVVLTVILAALAYLIVEKPFLRIKERFGVTGQAVSHNDREGRRDMIIILTTGIVLLATSELLIAARFPGWTSTSLWAAVGRGPSVAQMGDTVMSRMVYLPGPIRVATGAPVIDAWGHDSALQTGDTVVTSPLGEMLSIRSDGRVARLVAEPGRAVSVSNLGEWDRHRHMFSGMVTVSDGMVWAVRMSAIRPVNDNSDLRQGAPGAIPAGFWISPGGASYSVERLEDREGPFIRVHAKRYTPYLVVTGQDVLPRLDGVPVTAKAVIRSYGRGHHRLTVYDEVAPGGTTRSYVDDAPSSRRWVTLTVRVRAVHHPSPSDNFSVGLFDVGKGDWFDLREFSLFVGTIP
ncbi:MAG: acyltransferase [Nitrospira sp.]|nr:MAG: acyltransferase [Nitrospira sp.]